ncbi:MAG: hypothetical protein LBK99_23140 [Opitutaceae bacterium]|nr:hypothetical protein [Opitutaceae bacterium]
MTEAATLAPSSRPGKFVLFIPLRFLTSGNVRRITPVRHRTRTVSPSHQLPLTDVIVGIAGIPRSLRWCWPTTRSMAADC